MFGHNRRKLTVEGASYSTNDADADASYNDDEDRRRNVHRECAVRHGFHTNNPSLQLERKSASLVRERKAVLFTVFTQHT